MINNIEGVSIIDGIQLADGIKEAELVALPIHFKCHRSFASVNDSANYYKEWSFENDRGVDVDFHV